MFDAMFFRDKRHGRHGALAGVVGVCVCVCVFQRVVPPVPHEHAFHGKKWALGPSLSYPLSKHREKYFVYTYIHFSDFCCLGSRGKPRRVSSCLETR